MSMYRLFLAVSFLTAFLSAFALIAPGQAARVFAEDGAVETATALVFLAAGLTALRGALRGGPGRGWLGFAALAGIVACLDELSFGERIFGFEPKIVAGVRLDAVHDLAQIARRVLDDTIGQTATLAVLALGLALLTGLLLPALLRQGRPPHAPLLIAAIACVVGAQTLDLHLRVALLRHWIFKASYIEETLELSAGVFLLGFAVLCLRASRTTSGRLSPVASSRKV